MARVQILTDDLLFGSRLQADLAGAGHTVTQALVPEAGADAIVADLTHDAPARIAALAAAARPPVLAFFSHVEVDVRERARAAGFEVVVPRSRIAREGPALLAALLATGR
jgi:2-methylisocitrate lyase-like PEP mutase family enzyme